LSANPFSRVWKRIRQFAAPAPGPDHAAQLHFDRANLLSGQRRFAEAETEYLSALALEPDHAEAHYRLGVTLQDQHKLDAAAASFRDAVAVRPEHIQAHNNLGAVLQLQEKFQEALASYRCAVALKPAFDEPYLNLGRLQAALGDAKGAANTYRLAIEPGIEPAMFRHLLDAIEGVTTDRAPAEFARATFDHFAEAFDERLLEELDYRIPRILGERVCARFPSGAMRVLDLGCGTGLCAGHVRAHAAHITGVDLSGGMLAKARSRGIYDELRESDIVAYLAAATPSGFDAVLAADVFIYLGNLDGIFRDVSRILSPHGVFAFSIETSTADKAGGDGRDFVLQPSGHYAQTVGYVDRLAVASGFRIAEAFAATIRSGHGHVANGHVFVLVKP
jgi:predicted TPR repeat methyltransferase